ncbi:hypothetical protein C8Q73DRAFT_709599 [Cubamyces lactineus]|nr:hypothetical protein C8Q73DRAFT_709599 [Cubamyces lactineus]
MTLMRNPYSAPPLHPRLWVVRKALQLLVRPTHSVLFGELAHTALGTSSNVDALPISESTDGSELAPGILHTPPPTFDIASTNDPSVAEARTDVASIEVPTGLRLDPPSVPRPNHRISGRPDDVCARCWDGLFAEAFGLRHTEVRDGVAGSWSGGYEYNVSHDELLTCQTSNCVWYRFLGRGIFSEMLVPIEAEGRSWIKVGVGILESESETGKRSEERETEELAVVVNHTRKFNVSMTAGMRDTTTV